MAPRKRDKKNQQLTGTNIKKQVKNGKAYYYYIMPDGHHEPLAHGDEKASIEAAHALNRALRPSGNIVDRILQAPARPKTKNPPLVEVIDRFEAEWLPEQKYSENSLKQREIKLNQYRREWPHTLVSQWDTFMVAEFLRKFGAESARQHRVLLEQLDRFAASRGYESCRPTANVEKRKQEKRKRARHTWDGFKKIYDASPPWFKAVQDVALYSLQRRADLVAIEVDKQIDLKAKTIQILQQKSKNYDEPVFINITMGDELYKAVMSCIWSGINCPYLLRHKPKRITKQMRDSRLHINAVPADYLTRTYAKIRDKVGVYNHLPKVERPGIHSIRALGIWLYTKAGYSDEYIMALAGHANERMKARYFEGHERPAPVSVNADLSLSAVDLREINWATDLSEPLKALADSGE